MVLTVLLYHTCLTPGVSIRGYMVFIPKEFGISIPEQKSFWIAKALAKMVNLNDSGEFYVV